MLSNVLRANGTFPKGIGYEPLPFKLDSMVHPYKYSAGMQFFDREAMTFDTDNDFDTEERESGCLYKVFRWGNRFSWGVCDTGEFKGFATPWQRSGSGQAKGAGFARPFLATRPAFFDINIF